MKKVLLCSFFLVPFFVNAQTTSLDSVKTQKYTPLEKVAEPSGGLMKVYKFFFENLRYPKEAKRQMIEGKVWVEFVVDIDGSLTDIKVVEGLGSGCDEEAVRLVTAMGNKVKWTPGIQMGEPVRSKFRMPVIFKLK